MVYVDDLIVTGSHQNAVNKFILKLGQRFSITDLGSLNYFLSAQVMRNSNGIFLSQKKYIQDIIEKTQMAGARAINTPIAIGNLLCLEDSTYLDDPKFYRNIVGTLQYLALTRLDIAFAVNKLA